MAGFDVQRVIAAFQQGRQIKDDKEKKVRDVEDRDFELKQRQAQLKMDTIQHQILKRKLEQENLGAMQGQPGEEFQIPGLSATPGGEREDVPGGVPTYTAPIPGVAPQTKDVPLPSMQVSGVEGLGVPGYTAQPKSMQEMLRQARGEKAFESDLKREENTITLPAVLLGGKPTDPPVQVDKTIADNLISGVQSSQRQDDAQAFTAAENEKRLKAESGQKALDRAASMARTQQAAASRIQAASVSANRSQAQQLAQKFGTEQQVKNYQVIQEALNFVSALPADTKQSTDDQALIYSFAKVMDPNSVVREGEYATVAKYAQSWADNFGFDAKRVFSNSPFLTPEARKNMKDTILKRANSAKTSYDRTFNEYARNLDRITGTKEGKALLIDYDYEGRDATGGGGAANPYR